MRLEVLAHFDSADQLAKKAATDLAGKILALVRVKTAHIVLTGGTVGIKTLSELAPLLANQDLSGLHFWWGDERFVEASSQERNYVQAHEALVSKISIPLENLHQMPPRGTVPLAEAASLFASHIEELAPDFDIVLLGMGQDGHVASLFPGASPEVHGDLVVSDAHSPKPPSERISLSFEALSEAGEVWFLVSGADKASAVQEVFTEKKLPAALVSGQKLTRWYLDKAAAEKLTS